MTLGLQERRRKIYNDWLTSGDDIVVVAKRNGVSWAVANYDINSLRPRELMKKRKKDSEIEVKIVIIDKGFEKTLAQMRRHQRIVTENRDKLDVELSKLEMWFIANE